MNEISIAIDDVGQAVSDFTQWQYQDFIDQVNVLKTTKRYAEAEAILLSGIDAYPDEMWLKYHHAYLFTEQELWPRAKELWTNFCTTFPDLPEGYRHLAEALSRENLIDQSGHVIDEALAKFPPNRPLIEARAKLFEIERQWDKAIHMWQLAEHLEQLKKYGERIDLTPATYSKYRDRTPFFRLDQTFPVFGYWHDRSYKDLPSVGLWSHIFGRRYHVVTDEEICRILDYRRPNFTHVYRQINIPACRADLARLIYLYEKGGLYLDMHCAVGNFDHLSHLGRLYQRYSAVFFSYPAETDKAHYHVGNSIILARRRSPVIKAILDRAIDNVRTRYEVERFQSQPSDYNIYEMTGPTNVEKVLFGQTGHFQIMDAAFTDMAFNVRMNMRRTGDVIHPFYFYSYRKAGLHWSERQKIEPLFTQGS